MIGVQFPTHSLVPKSSRNHWEDVRDLSKAYGLVLDPWQENVLRGALGERSDGRWAATRVCLTVPRQNGKTALFEARELAGLLLFGEELIIHSAHRVSTALEGFLRIKHYFEDYDDLRRRVRRIREANGEQAIELMTGQRLMFKARARGAVRGFSPDLLMLDEAQILPERAWSSSLPAMSARPNPQAWLAGTPPGPEDDGEAFTRLRDASQKAADTRLCWMEWSVDGAADVDDRKLWAQANPGLGVRISADAIADERHSMDVTTFARERLGVWASERTLSVIPSSLWASRAIPESEAPAKNERPVALAVDMSPDRSMSIAGCWNTPVGHHVEILALDQVAETRAVVDWLAERAGKRITVVIDAQSPAASMVADLRARNVKVNVTSAADMGKACGGLYDAVIEARLTYVDNDEQSTIGEALRGAKKRRIGDAGAWGWDRKNFDVDISSLVAVTLARFGATVSKQPKQSTGGRRVVVMS
jgi:hypothetical protein